MTAMSFFVNCYRNSLEALPRLGRNARFPLVEEKKKHESIDGQIKYEQENYHTFTIGHLRRDQRINHLLKEAKNMTVSGTSTKRQR